MLEAGLPIPRCFSSDQRMTKAMGWRMLHLARGLPRRGQPLPLGGEAAIPGTMNLPETSEHSWPRPDGSDPQVEVAIIGDDEALADMYRLKLQVDGYAVTVFTTAQGYPRAGLHAPDIVYLDIGLLNAASLATHRRLRSRPATENVPIVLLSERLSRQELASKLRLGIHDFMISSDTARPDTFWDEFRTASHFRERPLV